MGLTLAQGKLLVVVNTLKSSTQSILNLAFVPNEWDSSKMCCAMSSH